MVDWDLVLTFMVCLAMYRFLEGVWEVFARLIVKRLARRFIPVDKA